MTFDGALVHETGVQNFTPYHGSDGNEEPAVAEMRSEGDVIVFIPDIVSFAAESWVSGHRRGWEVEDGL